MPKLLGIFLTIFYFLINLATINDYGVTWDFTYHFNAGFWHLKHPLTDPNFVMGPSPPLSDILPTLSYLFFYEKLKLLPWDAAYNFYSVLVGSLGIGILYFVTKQLFNWQIALFSSLTLAFLPRYFGHLHNNMKDIPQAVFFTLSVWMFYRLFKKPKIINLILASISLAIAFNSKVNAIFVLLIAFSFLIAIYIFPKHYIVIPNLFRDLFKMLKRVQHDRKHIIVLSYFILSPIAALLLWWPFWDDPIGRLFEARHSYTTSTTNMPILYFGNIFYSGNNVPWHYPIGLLTVTTPTLVLFFFLIGILGLIFDKKIASEIKLFVLLWFLIPLSRYLKPQMIVVDDIRHFMEVIFPFTLIAGVGMYKAYLSIVRILHDIFPQINKLFISIFYLLSVICYLLFQIISYHPYQTSYFSELIGGIKGANKKFDIEFWAHSYKYAMQYLNKNAPLNSQTIVAMAPDIAKLYLRRDLVERLNQQNMTGINSQRYYKSDYTVILNRQSFFDWYGITNYLEKNKPIFLLTQDRVPLVYIFKN